MAAVRDSDIALWLHNKLGTSSDTWSEGSICSQLNLDVLRNIKECFMELQTQVKLKLLLSFFHIPKRNVEEWQHELQEIIEVAIMDTDSWVAMLAEIIKTYPSSGNLNLEIREQGDNQRIVQDLTAELRRVVKKHCNDANLLPMELSYLNRSAYLAAAPQQPVFPKYFNLKRKPKAAANRADLVARSVDAQANVKKSQLPTVPVRSRGIPRNDTIPMKGITSVRNSSSFTGMMRSSNLHTPNRPRPPVTSKRKDGGVKLVEFSESPITQQAKKRRKAQDAAEAKASEAETKQQIKQQQQETAAATTNKRQQQQQIEQQVINEQETVISSDIPELTPSPMDVTSTGVTPDYAAGLTPSNPPTPGGPAAPQATPILSGTVASAAALQVGGSVQLPAGTIISRQSIQSATAGTNSTSVSTPTRQTQNIVTVPPGAQRILVTPNGEQRILLTQGGAGEQRFIIANPSGGGEQRILLAPQGGGEQRIILAQPGEQRVIVGPGGEQRIVLGQPAVTPSGDQRILLAPQGVQSGAILQQTAGGQTLVYRALNPAQNYGGDQQAVEPAQPQYATLQPVQPEVLYTLGNAPATVEGAAEGAAQQVIAVPPGQHQTIQTQQATQQQTEQPAQQQTTVQVVQSPQQQQQKRNLSLTREQMLEAQEMFRTSNKVTRPEKALILGFMAGSRDNPCPHLGNIVTIKLSEGEETVSQPGGTFISMLAETHFQMNYNTGEWRRIKKYRPLPVEQTQ